MHKEAFQITGFTLLVPAISDDKFVARFWDELNADGRLAKLRSASSVPPWLLGLGSWDPACEKKGFRYTICIEATEHTDFTRLKEEYPLFTKEIGASDWMCFEMTEARYTERFWKDDPYKMLAQLGYRFYKRNFSVGLHFDAYPPENYSKTNTNMEFWITVTK